jgi:nucleotide-binding universal stress UspA family protein
MTTKKILYATDYSEPSQYALPVAASLARDEQATLLIAHVSELEEYPQGELFDEDSTPSPQELEQLHAVKPEGPDVHCEYRLIYGNPAEAIVRLAKQEGASMIVVGTHGRTGLTHLLAGSVAEELIRKSSCPVVVVKKPAEQHDTFEGRADA